MVSFLLQSCREKGTHPTGGNYKIMSNGDDEFKLSSECDSKITVNLDSHTREQSGLNYKVICLYSVCQSPVAVSGAFASTHSISPPDDYLPPAEV